MGVLVVRVPNAELEECSDWLWGLGATAIEERPEADHSSVLVVGFGHDDLLLAARDVLGERWPSRVEDTGDERLWRDQWLKFIEPIEVAGFVVHAPWHDPALWAEWGRDKPTLSIDPGRAFGSGHHPTTRLCLAALRPLVDSSTRVLDVGCGTGILSIAAAKLGARSVLGIDLDYDIIEVASANAEANHVAGGIDLRTDALDQFLDRYDIVVANIVVGDLAPLMPQLIERVDGALIVSGYLDSQFDNLTSALDLEIRSRATDEGWGCATLVPLR